MKPDEEVAKIFSDRTRIKIIELLSEKELTNSQLAGLLNLSKPTISHHIRLLLDAGIVKISRTEHEKHGIQMKFYTVNPNILSVAEHKQGVLMEQAKKEIHEMMNRGTGEKNVAKIAFLRLLKSSMLNTGIELDKPLYDAGYDIGLNVISKQIKSSSLEGVLEELADIWKKLNLGAVELADANRIRVKDCYQCGHMPDVGKPLCPSDAGIIAGVLDKTIGKKHSVKEIKCWGTGYDICEFEIEEL
ncbi:MAG: V4R domain-containing protein [Methanolobus sp.]|nr:V4R domain-containing protein [Methanolobus sp.]